MFPKCNSCSCVKHGFVKLIQRYLCKNCGMNYSVGQKTTATTPDIRRKSIMMYLEGLGFRSIGRLLEVSHVSVIQWIKKYGSQLEELQNKNSVHVLELDEMHTYVGKKKMSSGFGLVLIEQANDTVVSLSETGVAKQPNDYYH
jgi:transposase-like protein